MGVTLCATGRVLEYWGQGHHRCETVCNRKGTGVLRSRSSQVWDCVQQEVYWSIEVKVTMNVKLYATGSVLQPWDQGHYQCGTVCNRKCTSALWSRSSWVRDCATGSILESWGQGHHGYETVCNRKCTSALRSRSSWIWDCVQQEVCQSPEVKVIMMWDCRKWEVYQRPEVKVIMDVRLCYMKWTEVLRSSHHGCEPVWNSKCTRGLKLRSSWNDDIKIKSFLSRICSWITAPEVLTAIIPWALIQYKDVILPV